MNEGKCEVLVIPSISSPSRAGEPVAFRFQKWIGTFCKDILPRNIPGRFSPTIFHIFAILHRFQGLCRQFAVTYILIKIMFLQATLQKKFDQSQSGQFWTITSRHRYVPTQEQFIMFFNIYYIADVSFCWWQNNHMGCKKPALSPKLPFQPFNTNHS